FAQFIVDSFTDFADGTTSGQKAKIIFLHHSTGSNVYKYTDLGVPNWVDNYNDENNTNFNIEEKSYPTGGNMPADYYLKWLAN
ncbi:MAG: hypothetical protein GY865_07610, partial [candidate division Zixibacteria bacterium]|nr:hypothetical protein [candidate division Zixibacteria bacterium]